MGQAAMTEMGTQCIATDKTWKMPGMQARVEHVLRKNLEIAGCHDIVVEEPRWELFSPDPDGEYDWEPYWAWEINAVGERDDA